MADFFISHATEDESLAKDVATWLDDCGEPSVFIASDAANGIVAGAQWQDYIFRTLRSCRAVVLVWTDKTKHSNWVFAELALARVLGLPVIPIEFGGDGLPDMVDPVQRLSHVCVEDTKARLAVALTKLRFDPETDWDRQRTPYPGLSAYTEADEGVFFGRESIISDALSALRQARDCAPTPAVALVGPSGSGKSSVLKAGVVPALKRDPERWIVIGPFRPLSDPLAELEAAVARTIAEHFETRPSTGAITALAPWESISELCRSLRQLFRNDDARVVIAVDQFEEMLALPQDDPSQRFVQLLTESQIDGNAAILALSMRSDMLAEIQRHRRLGALVYDLVQVPWLDEGAMAAVIEGPARLANLELEPGLVGRLVNDTSAAQALPHLAFTLRQMYDNREHLGELTMHDYERTGGLHQSVATLADEIMARLELSIDDPQIRRAVLMLAQRNYGSRWTRRTVAWTEVPNVAVPLFEALAANRLLTSDGKEDEATVEVTHESLFDSWTDVAIRLKDHGADLDLRDECQRSAARWVDAGEMVEHLWSGAQLAAAEAVADRGDAVLDPDATRFVAESRLRVDLADQEKARRRRNQIRILAGLAVALAVLAAVALQNWRTASQREITNAALAVASESRNQAVDDPALALALAIESTAITNDPMPEALAAMHDLAVSMVDAMSISPPAILRGHSDDVRSVSLTNEGTKLLSVGDDGSMRLWDTQANVELAKHQTDTSLIAAQIHPEGDRSFAGGENGVVFAWDLDGSVSALTAPGAPIRTLDVDWDDRRVAVGRSDGRVEIRDADEGWLVAGLEAGAAAVTALRFMPNEPKLAIARADGSVALWTVESAEFRVLAEASSNSAAVLAMSFSDDGTVLALGHASGTLELREAPFDGLPDVRPGHDRAIWGVEITAGRTEIVTTGLDGFVRSADPTTGRALSRPAGEGKAAYWALAMSEDGRVRATAGEDGQIRVWTIGATTLVGQRLLGHTNLVFDLAINADADRVYSASADGQVRQWRQRDNQWESSVVLQDQVHLVTLALNELGSEVAVGTARGEIKRLALDGSVLWSNPNAHADGSRVGRVRYVPGTNDIVSIGSDGALRLWSGAQRGERPAHEVLTDGPLVGLGFSSDGAVVMTSGEAGVDLWSSRTLEPMGGIATESPAWVVEADPRSDYLAVGEYSGRITLFDREQSELFAIETGSGVLDLAFDPRGEVLLSSHDDSAVRIWSLATGEAIGEAVTVHDDEVWAVEFGPDGKRWYTASGDSSVREWLRFWDVQELCGVVEQAVTAAEVEVHLPSDRKATVCQSRS